MPKGQDRTSFPGCTPLSDSEIATNPEYSTLYQNLQYTGWNASLSDLGAVVTLFAPTDQAFSRFKTAYNMTFTQAIMQPATEAQSDASVLEIFTSYHVTTEALPVSLKPAECLRAYTSCAYSPLLAVLVVHVICAAMLACCMHLSEQYSLSCCTHSRPGTTVLACAVCLLHVCC